MIKIKFQNGSYGPRKEASFDENGAVSYKMINSRINGYWSGSVGKTEFVSEPLGSDQWFKAVGFIPWGELYKIEMFLQQLLEEKSLPEYRREYVKSLLETARRERVSE